ncbi:MAG: YceI family protein [Planctomycetota bacterium]
MLRKILVGIGVLAVVAAVVLPITALVLLREKIVVEFGPARDAEVSQLALLSDENAQLRSDLAALAEANARNFSTLAEALRGDRRAGEAALSERLDALSRSIDALRGAVEAARIHARVEEDRAASDAANDDDSGNAAAEAAQPASDRDDVPEASTGFLRFDVPQSALDPETPQRFSVIGSLSRVGFDGKSTLHDFTGVTSAVTGNFQLAPNASRTVASGTIVVDVATLRTGVEGRDRDMRTLLKLDEHPELRFTLEKVERRESDEDDAATDRSAVTASGSLSIAGVTHPIQSSVTLEWKGGRRLTIEGEVPVRLTDFSIPPPSQLGFVEMEDEVRIWFSLRARWLGGARDGDHSQ